MEEIKICHCVLVDLLRYTPPSIPCRMETVVTKDGSVKIRDDLDNLTFTFEGNGIICIANNAGEHLMKFDTHAQYCRNVAEKDMLRHLANRYCELADYYILGFD